MFHLEPTFTHAQIFRHPKRKTPVQETTFEENVPTRVAHVLFVAAVGCECQLASEAAIKVKMMWVAEKGVRVCVESLGEINYLIYGLYGSPF